MEVLDHGYVNLVDHMGTDRSIVNAARVSFHKESKELTVADSKLLLYLFTNGHTSPFRHAFVTLEVKAPLFVARQWWKHVVGSDHTMESWNEVSRRYVNEEPEFYTPTWRQQATNKKQGSADPFDDVLIDAALTRRLAWTQASSIEMYKDALDEGVAVELARLFLPAYGMYTTWRWSASLHAILYFLSLRKGLDAQWEIQQYAHAVEQLIQPLFPATFNAWEGK